MSEEHNIGFDPLDDLTRELEAAKKDGERLDWLFHWTYIEYHAPGVYSSIVEIKERQDIDAARSAAKGGTQT